jgi:hypothetical protein
MIHKKENIEPKGTVHLKREESEDIISALKAQSGERLALIDKLIADDKEKKTDFEKQKNKLLETIAFLESKILI